MLEIRNLSKVYRSKTGEEVRALDNVSISFPESGMVFILGKSGSGKSTLLNIMGGLDSYDSGEFIIKGKSSKDFGGSDFDAYRNTFIGFIFQEYNVLDDFTVGANIGLALELQGKKATAEKINEILTEVDLLNYAKRKPNELSGGQKQRVAIARALVKEPQIIMADEPTGALDSNTGKQIFDSLKALSKKKLVLIVSHDRDFAERYADRIIELADGKIISDVTKHERESEKLSEGIDKISGNILKIKGGYRLTPADMQMINDYLANSRADVILSGDSRVNDELRSAAGISESGATSVFEETESEKDYKLKEYEKKDSNFIRSRLPLKNALRMGSSGLKHKKFRLVMTVILSLLAFAMFGFADTMAGYDKVTASVDSIMDSNIKNASVTVSVRREVTYDDGDSYVSYDIARLNDSDIEKLREETGLDFVPVFTTDFYNPYQGGFSVANMMQSYSSNATTVYTGKLHGLVCLSEDQLDSAGFNIIGRLPEKDGEIAITEFMYRQFNEYGFQNSDFNESVAAGSLTTDAGSPNSIIGKHISVSGNTHMQNGNDDSFEIVGIIDTKFDYDRYSDYLPKDNDEIITENSNALSDMVLQMEIRSEIGYGFHALGFLTEADINRIAKESSMDSQILSTYMGGWNSNLYISVSSLEHSEEFGVRQFSEVAGSSAISQLNITWLDGTPRKSLAANEVILPSNFIDNLIPGNTQISLDTVTLNNKAAELYGEDIWNSTKLEKNYLDRFTEAKAIKYINEKLNETDALNAIAEYASARGENVTTKEEAANYWKRLWFEEGNYGFTYEISSVSLKAYNELESEARSEILPFVLPLVYGIEYNDEMKAVSPDIFSSAFDILRNTSEENSEYSLNSYDIYSVFRSVWAERDIKENELWKNDELIAALINSGYYSQQQWDEANDEIRQSIMTDFYRNSYLNDSQLGYENNPYGEYSGKELEDQAEKVFLSVCGIDVNEILSSLKFERFEQNNELGTSSPLNDYDLKVVGFYDTNSYHHSEMIINDKILEDYQKWYSESNSDWGYKEDIAEHEEGIWAFALSPIGNDRKVIENLVSMSYDENSDLKFELRNPVMDTLGTFNEFIEIGSKIFLYVGIGFAVFSALLLMNFIATSISYKKREIGVLRAVGARSSDVFKIFFSEALIIAAINFVLSTAAVIAAIIATNTLMHRSGINVTLLSYGPRQFILMLLISIGVALLASFLPVYNIARRKPVDAIKDR